MMFFKVLIAVASGQFHFATYQFLEPISAKPQVCIVREVPVDVLSGPHAIQEARCLYARGTLIYVGYVREVSDI